MPANPEPATIRATFRWLNHTALGATEVRVVKTGGVLDKIGFFSEPSAFVRACVEANALGNVYVGIQARPARFLSSDPNMLVRRSSGGRTDDIEIVSSTVIDLDPVRPRDTASTDTERDDALAVADRAAAWFEAEGFERPQVMMSGNGAQLWLAFDPIALDADNRAIVAANLKDLEALVRERFETTTIKVDSIHDLGRIIKVIGTVARKGDDTAERPHRLSYPLGDQIRRPCAVLRARLLAPRAIAPCVATPASRLRRLPLRNDTLPEGSETTLVSSAPVSLCTPLQRLWDEGYPTDRSRALFGVTMMLAHKGIVPEQIIELVTHFDKRTGAKLVERDPAAYIRHDYDKILASSAGTEIKPPCKMVQDMGYCGVNVVPGAVCELHDPVLDVGGAIDALPIDLPERERNYRMRRIFDALADLNTSDAAPHIVRISNVFNLNSETIAQALKAASARSALRRQETAREPSPNVTHDATTSTTPVAIPPTAGDAGGVVLATLDGEIAADQANYFVPNRDSRRIISSFVLTPTHRIATERGEVIVASATTDLGTHFNNLQFPREAFTSRRDLLRHLPSTDMQWTGDDKHVQGLLRSLARHPGVVHQKGSMVLGGFAGDNSRLWIFPGGAISASGFVDPPPVVYVPTGNSLDKRVRFESTDDATFNHVARVVFTDLPHVNVPPVTVPLIGWFLATVLKPWVMRHYGSFPILNVTGTGGTGKTSMLCEVFLPLLGQPDAEPGSVTGTEFTLLRQLSSTSSIPIVLDEYKPQDMPQDRVDQIHRYARRIYKGEIEERGHADQSVTSYHLTAPLVIAGETRPSDAALLERFITASPTKGTLEAHPEFPAAFARLRATPLHFFAPRYIQFALARDLRTDLVAVETRVGAVIADRPMPLRVVTNLHTMALGVHLFEQFAEVCGMPRREPLDLSAGIDSVLRDVTGGSAQPRNALDHFVETIAVMASRRELREGDEYMRKEGILYVRFEQSYAAFRKHLRAAGYRENPIDKEPLRRLVRENFAQGGYVIRDPDADTRVYFTATQRYHAVAIDLERAAHLLADEFQSVSASLDAWPHLEEP